jgi:transcription initiation factor TFIIIB Brf1 subunit/transcription initiation factor TFIIB
MFEVPRGVVRIESTVEPRKVPALHDGMAMRLLKGELKVEVSHGRSFSAVIAACLNSTAARPALPDDHSTGQYAENCRIVANHVWV